MAVSRSPLSMFPKTIGEWKVINEQTIDSSSMAVLLVDDYLLRTYYNDKGNQYINLYIGYFQNQSDGKQIHSPRQCLPGAGYNMIEKQKIYHLALPGDPVRYAPVNLFVMKKGDEIGLYLWWYQGRGRTYASEYMNKYYQILDIITRKRSDGSLIRVDMKVQKDTKDNLKEMTRFISQLMPVLPQYIPD